MRRPLDVELLAIVERNGRILANQLVKYDTIIDALNLYVSAVKLLSAESELPWVDGVDAKQQLGSREVGIGLLLSRIEIHQDHFRRIVIAEDGAAGEGEEPVAIES